MATTVGRLLTSVEEADLLSVLADSNAARAAQVPPPKAETAAEYFDRVVITAVLANYHTQVTAKQTASIVAALPTADAAKIAAMKATLGVV